MFAISILQSYDFFSEHRLRLPKNVAHFLILMHNCFMIVYVHACVRGCLCLSGVAYRDRTPTAIRPYGSWCTGVWQLEYGRTASAVRSANRPMRVGEWGVWADSPIRRAIPSAGRRWPLCASRRFLSRKIRRRWSRCRCLRTGRCRRGTHRSGAWISGCRGWLSRRRS